MAVARESLSPLLHNVHTRRLSLELCQKIGNQIFSPVGGLSPSRSPGSTSMNWSPNKSFYTDSPGEKTGSFTQRRSSADLDVFTALSPCPPCGAMSACGKHRRRLSLTPLHQSHKPCVPPGLPFPIPSIRIQDSPHFQSPKKREASGDRMRKGSNFGGSGLFRNVIPNAAALEKRSCSSQSPPSDTIAFPGQRRKSSSSRYDFDEDFMRFVVIRWHLQLYPEQVLGRGSFGTVIQGKYEGELVAVKVIKTKTSSHLQSTKGEQNALGLEHPHVAHVIDIFQMGPERALVVMDLMKKGNLLKLLNDPQLTINSQVKIKISGQIASALQYCHQNDFGTSKRVSDIPFTPNLNRLEGTVAYKAPELFRGNIPTEKCDVYSFGICMWQILHREEPYLGLPEHAIIYQVVAQELRPDKLASSTDLTDADCPSELLQFARLYQTCWNPQPDFRPEMNNVVENLVVILYKL